MIEVEIGWVDGTSTFAYVRFESSATAKADIVKDLRTYPYTELFRVPSGALIARTDEIRWVRVVE